MSLGWQTKTQILSVPFTHAGLAKGDIDMFLGYWLPPMASYSTHYRDAETLDVLRAHLESAKSTRATNAVGAGPNVKDFKDIAGHAADLGGKIDGIAAGNDGHKLIFANELMRVCRRLIDLSYASMASVSRAAQWFAAASASGMWPMSSNRYRGGAPRVRANPRWVVVPVHRIQRLPFDVAHRFPAYLCRARSGLRPRF